MSDHRIGITFDTGGTEGDLSDVGKMLDDVAKGGQKAQAELKRTTQALREQGGSVNQVAASFTNATAKVAQFKNSAAAGLRSAARDGEQAAAAIRELEARIEEVRATGGPVPANWTAAVKSMTAAVDDSTRAHGRSRAAMEAQRREMEDATRTAGGFKNGFGSVSDILGEIHPKLETAALKAGLFWGAMQVIEGGANAVADSIGTIGRAFGSSADAVDKAVATMKGRLTSLFTMGPQMLAFSELAKSGFLVGGNAPELLGAGKAYGEAISQMSVRAKEAQAQVAALRSEQAQLAATGKLTQERMDADAAAVAGYAAEIRAAGGAVSKWAVDQELAFKAQKALDEQLIKNGRTLDEEGRKAEQAAEKLRRAAEAARLENEKLAAKSAEVVTSLKLQLEAEQRLTEAYAKGPKAVKALREELELEAALRKNLANVSPKDAPFVVMLTMALQRAKELNAEAELFAKRMNQFKALTGLQTVGPQLDPINSAPSLAAAKRSSFFDALGISEADFRRAHETAQEWRDREIAAIRKKAGDNLELVEEREQAILDIQTYYANEMVSNLQGALSALGRVGGIGQSSGYRSVANVVSQYQAGSDFGAQAAKLMGAKTGSATMGAASSVMGTFAVFYAIYEGVQSYLKKKKAARYGSETSFGIVDGQSGSTQLTSFAGKLVNTLKETVRAIEQALFASIQNMETIKIRARNDGKTFEAMVGSMFIGIFDSMDDAVSAAMAYALKNAEYKGLDPIVLATIQRSSARTMEELQAALGAALSVSKLGLSGEGAGFLDTLSGLDDMKARMIEALGPTFELADAIKLITVAQKDAVKAERARLLGIQQIEDFTRRLTDAQSFNTAIEKERERILREIAALQETINRQQAQANRPGAGGVDGGAAGGFGGGPGGHGQQLPSQVLEAQYAIQALMDQLAGLGDILNLEDVKKGIKDDILGNLYQFLEGNKKYAKQILAWKRKELEMQFEQYKLQLMALGMWDEATQKIWADARAAGLLNLRPGRGGGKGNRKDDEDGVKNALRDYGLSKLSGVTRALADINQRWDDHAKAAGKNADLLRQITAARLDEVNALVKQAQVKLRQDYRAFVGKDGGAVGAGMLAINTGADDLVKRARELRDLGKMGKAEFARLRDAIREAAAAQRQDLVNSTANSLFMELYGLLGMDKEAAQLKYDLTMAELNIKYQELAIAVEKYKLEGRFLPELAALIEKVKLAGPGLFLPAPANDPGGYGGGGGLQDMGDEIERVVKALREFRESLLLDEQLSPLTPQQRLDEAQRQYQETLRMAQGGNLEAASGLPDAARSFLEIFQEYTGGGGAYAALAQQILAQVRALETRLGGVPHYAQGGIVSHPHLAMVGDGGPEAIIPLKNGFIPSQPQGGDNARLIIGFFGKVPRTLDSIDSHLANIDDRLSSPFDRVASIESRKVRQSGRG